MLPILGTVPLIIYTEKWWEIHQTHFCLYKPNQGFSSKKTKSRSKLILRIFFYICHTLRSWLHAISAPIMILSPGLKKNYTLQWSFNSFSGTTSMSGCLENCWSSIPMKSFSPIQGTKSRLVLKFHVARIWECDIYKSKFKVLVLIWP